MTGACLCIPSEEARLSDLVQTVRQFQATWIVTTPSVARLLTPEDVPTLETVILGGEPATWNDLAQWRSRLIIMYGPAECCFAATVRSPVSPEHGPTSIGRALPSARTWIVDQKDHHRLVPVGVAGELLIEGYSVARGYYGNQEGSQQSFIDPPAWRVQFDLPGIYSFYKTGDLVCYLPDGSLKFLGRRDSQVKLRGQRLELGDVEHHVKQAFPQAPQVVVDIVTPIAGALEPILMAFICQDDDLKILTPSQTSTGELLLAPSDQFLETVRSALPVLRTRVPAFMVPAIFLPITKAPMTAAGKIDRRRIRTRAAELGTEETAKYSVAALTRRPPSTETEVQLHTLVSRILNLSPDVLGVDDDIVQRGLDSILAMKLVVLAKKGGVSLAVPDIFSHPRISALADVTTPASAIETQYDDYLAQPGALLDTENYDHMVTLVMADQPFDKTDVEDMLPTKGLQREYLDSEYRAYFVLRFSSNLNSTQLKGAIQSIVQKHSILRTVFIPFEGTILQIVLRDAGSSVSELFLEESDFPAALRQFCQDDRFSSPGSGGRCFQAMLARGQSGQSALILRLTHAQYDGFSISSLFRDISAAYNGISLTSVPSFRDTLAHRAHLRTPTAFRFWEDLLKDSSMTEIGKATTNQKEPSTLIEREHTISFPPLPSRFTLATINKAAWSLTLARETKSRDLVFGQVVTGRNTNQDGIHDVLGPCINKVPVRVTLHPTWTVADLLQHVQSQHLAAMEFETAEFVDIVKRSTFWPDNTCFGSVIHYQNLHVQRDSKFGELSATHDTYHFNTPCPEPHVACLPGENNTLLMSLFASSHQLGEDDVDRLLSVLCDIFTRLIADPHQLVNDLL